MTSENSSRCSESEQKDIFLQVNGLTRHYGRSAALDNVSFSLRREEVLGVIGPSGSGKTTLLRCLDLLEGFDKGSIEYPNGAVVRSAGSNRLEIRYDVSGNFSHITEDIACGLRRGIGFVFQGFNLWNERTVLDNLTLAPRVVDAEAPKSAAQRAEILCQQFGLRDKLYARPWQLSGGQRQRIAILRALMMNPQLILLDEVTSALDPVLTVEVMAAIRTMRGEGLTMIIVTHHLHFATKVCDRLAFLSDGRLVQLDTAENLQKKPATDEVNRFLTILADAT